MEVLLYFLYDKHKSLYDKINNYNDMQKKSQLIWKTLNYSGYDIPPEWFKVNLDTEDEYRQFNSIVKELSKIDGWDIFTIYCLLASNIIVNNIYGVKKYFSDFNGTVTSLKSILKTKYDQYKMATYGTETIFKSIMSGGKYGIDYKYKYEKYKKLYLELKSKIIS